jgi:pimeloyl-ACP methyl ester carboxylesterase
MTPARSPSASTPCGSAPESVAKVRFERTTDWAAASRVVFFGGNGHCAARLNPARSALARKVGAGKCAPLEIEEVKYPGFEGRAPAATLEEFLAEAAKQAAQLVTPGSTLYATGAGGLFLLALRARDAAPGRIILQAPVLWGLEARRFPLWMRVPAAGAMVRAAMRLPPIRWWFSRKYFTGRVPGDVKRGFFRGYAKCPGFAKLFSWLEPAFLRDLEARFREKPSRLENIEVWWGSRDRVLTKAELVPTEAALGFKWPLREFPEWGHYPMIESPEEWISALGEGTTPRT